MTDQTEITILPDPALEELNRRIEKSGSQSAVADELEVSPAYLNDILKGRRDLSVNMLAKLGHKRIVANVPDEYAALIVKAIEIAHKGLSPQHRREVEGFKILDKKTRDGKKQIKQLKAEA